MVVAVAVLFILPVLALLVKLAYDYFIRRRRPKRLVFRSEEEPAAEEEPRGRYFSGNTFLDVDAHRYAFRKYCESKGMKYTGPDDEAPDADKDPFSIFGRCRHTFESCNALGNRERERRAEFKKKAKFDTVEDDEEAQAAMLNAPTKFYHWQEDTDGGGGGNCLAVDMGVLETCEDPSLLNPGSPVLKGFNPNEEEYARYKTPFVPGVYDCDEETGVCTARVQPTCAIDKRYCKAKGVFPTNLDLSMFPERTRAMLAQKYAGYGDCEIPEWMKWIEFTPLGSTLTRTLVEGYHTGADVVGAIYENPTDPVAWGEAWSDTEMGAKMMDLDSLHVFSGEVHPRDIKADMYQIMSVTPVGKLAANWLQFQDYLMAKQAEYIDKAFEAMGLPAPIATVNKELDKIFMVTSGWVGAGMGAFVAFLRKHHPLLKKETYNMLAKQFIAAGRTAADVGEFIVELGKANVLEVADIATDVVDYLKMYPSAMQNIGDAFADMGKAVGGAFKKAAEELADKVNPANWF